MQEHAVSVLPEDAWGLYDSGQLEKFPKVLSRVVELPNCRLLLEITPELHSFEGHFPGRPVLAGATQLHWAVCVSRSVFSFDKVPMEIKQLKFKNIVVPPATLELSVKKLSESAVQFEVTSAGQIHSQGRLIFDEVSP